jgi:hypothetical protein
VLSKRSQFLDNRLFLFSHAKLRSTTHRLGITANLCSSLALGNLHSYRPTQDLANTQRKRLAHEPGVCQQALHRICSPPPHTSRTPSRPDQCPDSDSGSVLKVNVLRHQAGRLKMADPAVHGFMDEVVGHPRLQLTGLHR